MIFDRTFWKFILVGLVNTLMGTAIMFTLYNIAGLGYWASSAANYILTSVLSFFLNKYFTFQIKYRSAFMVFAFAGTIIIAYLIAYGIAKPAIYFILRDQNQKIRDNVSLFTGMCLFTGINYMGQRFFVFSRTLRKEGKPGDTA
jgi:putative flippase GtrA